MSSVWSDGADLWVRDCDASCWSPAHMILKRSCAQKPASLWNGDKGETLRPCWRFCSLLFLNFLLLLKWKNAKANVHMPSRSYVPIVRLRIVGSFVTDLTSWPERFITPSHDTRPSYLDTWSWDWVSQSRLGAQRISRALLVLRIITTESSMISVFWPVVWIHVWNICWDVHSHSKVWTHPIKCP